MSRLMIINKSVFFEVGKIARNRFNRVVFVSTIEEKNQFDSILKYIPDWNFVEITKFNSVLSTLLDAKFYVYYKKYNGDLTLFINETELGKSSGKLLSPEEQDLIKTGGGKDDENMYESIHKFTEEEIGKQFFDSASFRYFQNEKLQEIVKKLMTKLLSNFRNFTKKSMELKKLWSVIKNIWENHLNNEMKNPEIAELIQNPSTFMKFFIKELFEWEIITMEVYKFARPDIWYSLEYLEKLAVVELNLKNKSDELVKSNK